MKAIHIREMRGADGRAYLDVHRAAVRSNARRHYPESVIEEWAPIPVTKDMVEGLLQNETHEIRVVAEIKAEVVGLAALCSDATEIVACYVHPDAHRRGIGAALIARVEAIAQSQGVRELTLHASLNAEAFYSAVGYASHGVGEHILWSGQRMACVLMRKTLRGAGSE